MRHFHVQNTKWNIRTHPTNRTTQPSFIRCATFSLLIKSNLQQRQELQHAQTGQQEYDTAHGGYTAQCPPLTETVEKARGPCDKAGLAKIRRPTGPHSCDMEGTAALYTVLFMSSNSLKRGRLQEHSGRESFNLISERPGPDAALFNLGPWHNTRG